MERRLAAILAADVVGYSRLMGEAEVDTLQRLTLLRGDVIEPLIAAHGGRLVKLMGDGLLVEFASAVDAVECAIAWQEDVTAKEAETDASRRLRFRIGVNLGDVIVQDGDLYGDGVNVAARLEAFAEPDGICVSGKVHEEVRQKLDVRFDDLGKKDFKNIADAVRVYRVQGEMRAGAVPLTLPDKPSIAVLAFENMSGDAEQEYLADGITEDLITALSKIRWFFVIARNSSFAYKGKAVNVSRIARELGVRYVLEGSVRKAGQRVRITAQLIDTTTGSHVWAEHYDRDIEDIFALQDEMTQTIVSAVDSEIGTAERERALRKPPESLDVWEIYQRGLWHLWRFDPPDIAEAIRLFRHASNLDPTFAPAYAYEAYAHYVNVIQGYVENTPDNLEKAMDAARKAVSLDARDAIAHFALGRVHTMRGEHDAALSALEEAVSLNPNLAQAYHGLGWALVLSGQLEKSVEMLGMAIRLSPRDPRVWATMVFMSLAFILKEDHEAAADWASRAMRIPNDTGYWSCATLAAALANMGRIEAARDALVEALNRKPDLTLGYLKRTLPFRAPASVEPYLRGLKSAGLPD